MTPQEQQLIAGLIDRVQKTQLTEKDPDAEQMLRQGLGTSPNALYILAQTVLVQQFALEQAKRQLADAQAQAQAPEPKHATSFLGNLFGHSDPAPPPPPQQGYQPVPGYSQAPPTSQAGYQQQPPPQFQTMGARAGGGFMRSALQTATGVAAGALAFEGVESLLHGFGGGGGFGGGQGLGGFGSGGRPEEIVNNYYGDSAGRDSSLSPDIEDRRSQFGDDSGSNNQTDSQTDDQQFADDASNDDTSSDDDSSSFDDGSSDSGDLGDLGGGGDDSSFS